jgi:hypothetical protein
MTMIFYVMGPTIDKQDLQGEVKKYEIGKNSFKPMCLRLGYALNMFNLPMYLLT